MVEARATLVVSDPLTEDRETTEDARAAAGFWLERVALTVQLALPYI